eukprot:76153-Rhodomonas_salina.4
MALPNGSEGSGVFVPLGAIPCRTKRQYRQYNKARTKRPYARYKAAVRVVQSVCTRRRSWYQENSPLLPR